MKKPTTRTRALVASSLAGLLVAAAMLVAQPAASALQGTDNSTQQTCAASPWQAGAVYVGGDVVSHNGNDWRARWWTQGETPGSAEVWAELGPCEEGTPGPTPPCTDPPWQAGTVYTGGDRVTHEGRAWEARWWTQGETPGTNTVWQDLGPCGDGTPPTSSPTAEPTATTTPPPTTNPPEPPSDSRVVGYFTQWGIYARSYFIRDLHTSGQAANLTHINYAFGNVNEQGRCFEANQLGQGDAWADYQRRFTAAQSVDGVADTFDQPLAGNFNQIRELKEMYPNLRVMFSLGGWTWSRYFSNAALPENREAFVESCIDMFIKGNLPQIGGEPQGGPGSAFGVFDGIDLDWEWPGSEGNTGNVIREADRENFTAVAAEFREQLDAYGAEVGRTYELSAFLPADPAKVTAGFEVPQIFDHLDFATVQGYDLYGPWETTTNHQGQLRNPPGNPAPPDQQFSVEIAIDAYVSQGADPSDLVLGVPAYARGWTGVPDVNDGLYQQGTGPVPASSRGQPRMFEDGVMDYKWVISEPGVVFRDNTHGAVWRYDAAAGEFWTYDDPQLIAVKGDWVQDNGLGGLMIWSLDGDADGVLVQTMSNSLN